MNKFRVWLSPLGSTCRVRVDGIGNAKWLVNRLGRSFVFKTADPLDEEYGSSFCTFHLECSSQTPRRGIERLLASIPEVQLMVATA